MNKLYESSKRAEAVKQMKLALNEENEVSMYYCGGTLCIDIAEDELVVVVVTDGELTDEERILAAKLYIEHKTPKHHYYEFAQSVLQGEQNK
jgi:hypothetical protein